MSRQIQRYEVSLKAFILREGQALFVREADSGYWELPGGRIDVGEEWEPHSAVLAREIREELGEGLALEVGNEAVTWTRQRPTDNAFLLIIARPARIIAGEPALSDEHTEMGWFSLEEAQRLAFPERSGYVDGIRRLWRLARPGRVQ